MYAYIYILNNKYTVVRLVIFKQCIFVSEVKKNKNVFFIYKY